MAQKDVLDSERTSTHITCNSPPQIWSWCSSISELHRLFTELINRRRHWPNNPFWANDFLRRYCQAHLFHPELYHPTLEFSGLHKSNFLLNKVISFASNPQPGRLDLCIYIPPWQSGPVIPQAPGSLFVAFYDLQGYSGGMWIFCCRKYSLLQEWVYQATA
jgi:hypothetical protein